jgi:hypothetical protein
VIISYQECRLISRYLYSRLLLQYKIHPTTIVCLFSFQFPCKEKCPRNPTESGYYIPVRVPTTTVTMFVQDPIPSLKNNATRHLSTTRHCCLSEIDLQLRASVSFSDRLRSISFPDNKKCISPPPDKILDRLLRL